MVINVAKRVQVFREWKEQNASVVEQSGKKRKKVVGEGAHGKKEG